MLFDLTSCLINGKHARAHTHTHFLHSSFKCASVHLLRRTRTQLTVGSSIHAESMTPHRNPTQRSISWKDGTRFCNALYAEELGSRECATCRLDPILSALSAPERTACCILKVNDAHWPSRNLRGSSLGAAWPLQGHCHFANAWRIANVPRR